MRSFFAPLLNVNEFSGFHIEPPTAYCTHRIGTFPDGTYHFAEILQPNPTLGSVHRAYPCWQPCKIEPGYGPCILSLDFKYWTPTRVQGNWFSILTLARQNNNVNWDPVCLNIDNSNNLYLMHAPSYGQAVYNVIGDPKVSMGEWHHLDLVLDFRANGSVTVLMDGSPRLQAQFDGLAALEQAHAGLYAAGSLGGGWVANSNLCVRELEIVRTVY
jgi:hypothetical protein